MVTLMMHTEHPSVHVHLREVLVRETREKCTG